MKIRDLEIEVFKGINFKNKLNDGLFRIIPSGANFPNGIRYNKCKYVNIINEREKKKKLIDGDILFNTGGVGTLGRSSHYISDEIESYCDGFILVIRTLDDRVYSKFLFYMFQSEPIKQEIINNTRGTTGITSIRTDDILNFEIPFPNINKQKEIVEILDQAFESIDKAKDNIEKNIENAKELFQSKINQIFSQTGDDWEENEFGDVITTLTDYHANGSYKILKKNVVLKDKEDYAWMIRSTDFEKKFKNQFKYIDKHAYNFLSKSKVFGNELIMSKIGNAGKIYLMPKVDRPVSLAMNLFLIRLDEKRVLSEFIFQFLQSKIGKIQIKERVKGTTTKTITKNNVRNIIVLYPPITKQKEIVETLNIMDNHIQSVLLVYEEELKNPEELKKSILQKAFSGELTKKSVAA